MDSGVILLAGTPQEPSSDNSSKRRTRTRDRGQVAGNKRSRDAPSRPRDEIPEACISDLQDMLTRNRVCGCVVTGEVKESNGHVVLPLQLRFLSFGTALAPELADPVSLVGALGAHN